MGWVPPAHGDVGLRFIGGETVWLHAERLSSHAFFAALLSPSFQEGLAAGKGAFITLHEQWEAFQPTLQAIYGQEITLSSHMVRASFEAADRCGVVPAVDACLQWISKHFCPTIFYQLAPLLDSNVAIASASKLRRAIFQGGSAEQKTQELVALVQDERWELLSVGLREEVLDGLECSVTAQFGADARNSARRCSLTVAEALRRRGTVPADVPELLAKYERLEKLCTVSLESRALGEAGVAEKPLQTISGDTAIGQPVESSLRSCIQEVGVSSPLSKSAASSAPKTSAGDTQGLSWTAWTTTASENVRNA